MLGCYKWFHRQLQETAEERYYDRKAKTHWQLAEYFNGMIDDKIVISKGIQRQPILLFGEMFEQRNAVINIRRCQEVPTHMLESLRPLTERAFECSMGDMSL